MLRRIVRALLICLVPLALLAVAGIYLASRTDWVHAQVRAVIAEELAKRSGREVQVGEIEGDLLSGVVVNSFAIAAEGKLEDGVVLAAERIRLDYDLFAMLRGKALLACLQRVELEQAYADVVRDESGVVNLTQIFPPAVPPIVVPPEQRFRGQIVVRDSVIDYRDEVAPTRDGQPIEMRFTDVQGEALVSQFGPLRAHLEAGSPGERVSAVILDVNADTEKNIFAVDGTLDGVDAAWWYDRFVQSPGFQLTSGHLHGRFTLWSGTSGDAYRGLDYYACAQISDATAHIAYLGEPVYFAGRVSVTPEGIDVESLTAQWDGAQVTATGNLFDWAHLGVDLSVQVRNLASGSLLTLLPLQTRQSLDVLQQAGRIDADLRVAGPVPDLTVDLAARSAGQLQATLAESVRVKLTGFELQATVPNVVDQAVAARASAQQASITPLTISTPSGSETVAHTVRISDVAGLEAELLYAGDVPVLESTLQVEQVTVDDLPITGLSAGVQMAGPTVRLSGVRAQVAGGELVGQALAEFNQHGPPTVYFDLAARDLQLAEAARLRGFDTADLAGQANLLLVGSVAAHQPTIAARARVRGLRFQDVVVEEAVGLVQWCGEDIDLPIVQLRSDMGRLWAHGAVSLDGEEMDLQLTAADLDIAAWGRHFNKPDLTGTAYLQGSLTGSLDDLAGTAQLVAFDAGSRDFAVDALFGKLKLERSAVQLEELLAARGPATLRAAGRLAGLGDDFEQMPVAGDIRIVGIQLEEVSDLADLNPPVSGVGEVAAVVAGTVDDPRLSIQVGIPYGSYGSYPITEASIAVTADRDSLRVSEGHLMVAEAPVDLEGQVEKWLEYLQDSSVKPEYSIRLSVKNADLQAFVPPEKTDVQIEGRVDLPVIQIRSTPDGPIGKAHLLLPQLVIGGQQVSAIDTIVVVAGGKVSLQDTTLRVGDAEIQAGASYFWEQKQAGAQLKLTGGRIEALLRLAVPISKLVATDGGGDISRDLRSYSLRTRGAVELLLDVQGSPEALTAQVQTQVTQLSFDRKDLPDVSGKLTLDLVEGELAMVREIDMEVTQGEGLLTIEGEVDPDGELSLFADGTNFSIAQWRQWLPEAISLGGTVSLLVDATGPSRSPALMGSLDVFNPTFQGVHFDLARIPVLRLDQNGLDIDIMLLKLDEQEIVASGKLPFRWEPLGLDPQGEITLSGKIENTDLSFFPPLLDEFFRSRAPASKVAEATIWSEFKARGQVNSEVTIAGKLHDPVLQGYLRLSDARLAVPGVSHGFDNLQIDVDFARQEGQNIVDIRTATMQWDETAVTVAGQAWLRDFSTFWGNEFDLSVDLDSPEQSLFGQTVVKDLTGRIMLASQADSSHLLTIEEIKGALGPGTVQVAGWARLANFDPAQLAHNQADIRLDLSDAAFKYIPVYDGLVDGSITLANPEPEQPVAVGGRLVLHDARVAPPAGGAGAGGPVYGWGPNQPALGFDLVAGLGPNVVLKIPSLSATLEPTAYAVHATGTSQKPLVTGRIEVRPERASVPAGSVRITELGVAYRYGPMSGEYRPPVKLGLSGEIWGQAEQIIASALVDGRQLEQLRILINIDGNLPEPINLHLTSEPSLSEDQLYQIIGAQPLGLFAAHGAEGTDIARLLSQQFSGLLAAGFRATILRPLEEQIKQALGLDQFTVLFGFDQPVDVRIGKHVMENLLVSYRHNVVSEFEDEWDLSLSYELPRRLRVSFATDEKGDSQFRIGSTREF